MQGWYLGLLGALVVAGCGPSYGGHPVKTPAQLVAEQEQLASQQAKSDGTAPSAGAIEDTGVHKKPFDKHQAKLELRRAEHSAETCVGVVSQDSPHGKAKVTLTFGHDGHVKKFSIEPPFAGTDMGKCVLNAMKVVIVPPFQTAPVTMDWEINLSLKKQPDNE